MGTLHSESVCGQLFKLRLSDFKVSSLHDRTARSCMWVAINPEKFDHIIISQLLVPSNGIKVTNIYIIFF